MQIAIATLTLATVLQHAGAYIAEFEQRLSAIVAEERYHQEWVVLPRKAQPASTGIRRRDLVSTLRLMKTRGPEGWLQFRDVEQVDGIPVARAPIDPGAPPKVDRSAVYNIGDIKRSMINTPLFTLKFLEAGNQHRFKFAVVTDRVPITVAGSPDIPGVFRTSTEIWVIEYDERARPTMIRDRDVGGGNVPAHGRFWIEPESGRVLMSEVVAENRDVRGTIDVSYQSEPLVGMLVPVEMRERYDGTRTGSRVETTASYGRLRQLEE